ncbi:hypothetical protein YC2023_084553 [Brassica napus]|uniref:(rape) hypothetical protein n=1 Tax=Brassica napus TaxID=3708 RepID=A0A816MI91_BRANA|nr:unnamed protein product [Brassica napus]
MVLVDEFLGCNVFLLVRPIYIIYCNGSTKKVLVDSLADLPCLSYHFDNEIEEVSKHAFERREDLIANENDLHTVSIIFRVFRTYGDYVLSGNSGKFKKSLVEDVKGMLSFYEAVAEHAHHIFSSMQKALHIYQCKTLGVRGNITFYEQEEDRDDTLIKLAKLTFEFIQPHYFKELEIITMWWRELEHKLIFPADMQNFHVYHFVGTIIHVYHH